MDEPTTVYPPIQAPYPMMSGSASSNPLTRTSAVRVDPGVQPVGPRCADGDPCPV